MTFDVTERPLLGVVVPPNVAAEFGPGELVPGTVRDALAMLLDECDVSADGEWFEHWVRVLEALALPSEPVDG